MPATACKAEALSTNTDFASQHVLKHLNTQPKTSAFVPHRCRGPTTEARTQLLDDVSLRRHCTAVGLVRSKHFSVSHTNRRDWKYQVTYESLNEHHKLRWTRNKRIFDGYVTGVSKLMQISSQLDYCMWVPELIANAHKDGFSSLVNVAISAAPSTFASQVALSLTYNSAATPEFNKVLSCNVPAWTSFNPLNMSALPSL
jgi:hypothetical protein